MNRLALSIVSLLVIGALSIPTFAQQQDGQPPGQTPGDQGAAPLGPGGFNGAGRGPGGFGARGGRGGLGRNGQGPNGGRGPLAAGPEASKYEALRDYIEVVERFTELSRNPEAAGVAAVVSATDLLRQRGPESAIEYLNKTLPDVKSPTIQRAIRIQLVDLYKQSGQSEKALEQLDALMKAQP
jgi:hypothetical protein